MLDSWSRWGESTDNGSVIMGGNERISKTPSIHTVGWYLRDRFQGKNETRTGNPSTAKEAIFENTCLGYHWRASTYPYQHETER